MEECQRRLYAAIAGLECLQITLIKVSNLTLLDDSQIQWFGVNLQKLIACVVPQKLAMPPDRCKAAICAASVLLGEAGEWETAKLVKIRKPNLEDADNLILSCVSGSVSGVLTGRLQDPTQGCRCGEKPAGSSGSTRSLFVAHQKLVCRAYFFLMGVFAQSAGTAKISGSSNGRNDC
eukprot:2175857-Rhodomonas_salina.1